MSNLNKSIQLLIFLFFLITIIKCQIYSKRNKTKFHNKNYNLTKRKLVPTL